MQHLDQGITAAGITAPGNSHHCISHHCINALSAIRTWGAGRVEGSAGEQLRHGPDRVHPFILASSPRIDRGMLPWPCGWIAGRMIQPIHLLCRPACLGLIQDLPMGMRG